MPMQLPLSLKLHDDATFANFFAGDNANVVAYLKDLGKANHESFVYLYADTGTGKSHLLQACCHEYGKQKRSALYLPMREHRQFSPEVLEGLETMQLVCIDDIQCVLQIPAWEEALFHLYNRLLSSGTQLLMSANVTPQQLVCDLPDLHSRLTAGLVFQLVGLDDEQKLAALQMRANCRGLELPRDVGVYLMNHYPRNMAALFDVFEMLDRASMIAKRRLTIPFVKSVLGFDDRQFT